MDISLYKHCREAVSVMVATVYPKCAALAVANFVTPPSIDQTEQSLLTALPPARHVVTDERPGGQQGGAVNLVAVGAGWLGCRFKVVLNADAAGLTELQLGERVAVLRSRVAERQATVDSLQVSVTTTTTTSTTTCLTLQLVSNSCNTSSLQWS